MNDGDSLPVQHGVNVRYLGMTERGQPPSGTAPSMRRYALPSPTWQDAKLFGFHGVLLDPLVDMSLICL